MAAKVIALGARVLPVAGSCVPVVMVSTVSSGVLVMMVASRVRPCGLEAMVASGVTRNALSVRVLPVAGPCVLQMMVVSEAKARDLGGRVYLRAGRRECGRRGDPVMRTTGVRGLVGCCRCCGPRRCRRR